MQKNPKDSSEVFRLPPGTRKGRRVSVASPQYLKIHFPVLNEKSTLGLQPWFKHSFNHGLHRPKCILVLWQSLLENHADISRTLQFKTSAIIMVSAEVSQKALQATQHCAMVLEPFCEVPKEVMPAKAVGVKLQCFFRGE